MQYQLNRVALQKIQRELAMRVRALPTLKAKETALRLEIRKTEDELGRLQQELRDSQDANREDLLLWNEYPGLLQIESIAQSARHVAGVTLEVISEIRFHVVKAGLFHQRAWVVKGTDLLQNLVALQLRISTIAKNLAVLDTARKKATQKVNLYEKIQIPGYSEALRKIRGFLDDRDNLSRAAQKISRRKATTGSLS